MASGEPRQLRAVLERLARQQAAVSGLFFTEPVRAWSLALQARTLAELMGLATGV
jgi:hypothetical protein